MMKLMAMTMPASVFMAFAPTESGQCSNSRPTIVSAARKQSASLFGVFGNRDTAPVRIRKYREPDAFLLSSRRLHHELDAAAFQIGHCLIQVADVQTQRDSPRRILPPVSQLSSFGSG